MPLDDAFCYLSLHDLFTSMHAAWLLTGFAKLRYDPGDKFFAEFVEAFMGADLEEIMPHTLSSVINGETTPRMPLIQGLSWVCGGWTVCAVEVGGGRVWGCVCSVYERALIATHVWLLLPRTGLMKLKHGPQEAFLRSFVEQCMGVGLWQFNALDLSLVIFGATPRPATLQPHTSFARYTQPHLHAVRLRVCPTLTPPGYISSCMTPPLPTNRPGDLQAPPRRRLHAGLPQAVHGAPIRRLLAAELQQRAPRSAIPHPPSTPTLTHDTPPRLTPSTPHQPSPSSATALPTPSWTR